MPSRYLDTSLMVISGRARSDGPASVAHTTLSGGGSGRGSPAVGGTEGLVLAGLIPVRMAVLER